MKWIFTALILVFLPLALVLAINQNSSKITSKQCSWKCHDNTPFCKAKHSNLLKPYTSKIDIVYNFIISSLASTGNYKQANIIFLVLLWPLFMLSLIIANIYLYKKRYDGKFR